MAPEVIEMKGASAGSDIWSIGCTVIELVTGAPPYWHLGGMAALFAMVDKPHPPIPENISEVNTDCSVQPKRKEDSAISMFKPRALVIHIF